MADPSGQTVILLRNYPIARSDIAAEAQSCIEYVRANRLPDYIGPLVVEPGDDYRDLWLTHAGKKFWDRCQPETHAVLYSLNALDRRPVQRRDSLDRVLSLGVRLHVIHPVATEVTPAVRAGMALEADRLSKERWSPKRGDEWGLCVSKIRRHGVTHRVPIDRPWEVAIANQVIGRSILGEPQTDILNWLRKWTAERCYRSRNNRTKGGAMRYHTRCIGDQWTHEKVVRMLRDYVGRDHEAYKYWTTKESK